MNPLLARESSADLIAPTMEQARVLAASSGKRVLILDRLTASTSTFANPDGTFGYLTHDGIVRTRTMAGDWAPVDTIVLPLSGGRLGPVNNLGAVTFSAGGSDRTVATHTPPGSSESLQLGWGGDLPAGLPVGDTVTYPQVQPGVDLLVKALPEGFEFSVRLLTRPIGPVSYTFPLQLPTGWTATQGSDGSVTLTDANGAAAGSITRTHTVSAWRDPLSGDAAQTSDTATQLVTTSTGQALRIAPDPAFLADPSTVFPVTLDPQISLDDTDDTYVDQGTPSISYYTSPDLAVGGKPGSPVYIRRAYLNFNTRAISTVAPSNITSATLGISPEVTSSCVNFTVEVWNSNSTISSGTTFANQPGGFTSHWSNITLQNTGTGCSGGVGTTTADMTTAVKSWAGTNTVKYAIALKTTTETDSTRWAKFYGNDSTAQHPYIGVIYYGPPIAPTANPVQRPSANTCRVSWTQSGSNSYPATTGFYAREMIGNTQSDYHSTDASTRTTDFTGKSPKITYTYNIYETNAAGDSQVAYLADGVTLPTCTPTGQAPTTAGPVVATAGDNAVSASWQAPSNTTGTAPLSNLTGYSVQLQDAAGNSIGTPVTVTTTSYTFSGNPGTGQQPLNGNSYKVAVTPLSPDGNGPPATSNTVLLVGPTPGQPQNVLASAGNASVTVGWDKPANAVTGGATITSYTVQLQTAAGLNVGPAASVPATSNSHYSYTFNSGTNPAPANGTSYKVAVSAVGPAGTGLPGVSNIVTPLGPPPAPQNVTATSGDRSVTVTWNPPVSDGTTEAVTSYRVQLQTTAGANVGPYATVTSTGAAQYSYTFTSSTNPAPVNGTAYQVAVTSQSSSYLGGTGVSGSTTPSGPPLAPTLTSATEQPGPHAGTTDVLAQFTVGGDNGAAIDSCRADATDGSGTTLSGYGTGSQCGGSIDIPGLAYNTTYTVRVYAHNVRGYGAASNSRTVTTGQDGTITKALAPGSPSTVAPGDTLTYQISVAAPASSPLIINRVTDLLPAGMRIAAPSSVLVNGGSCAAAGFVCAANDITDATGAVLSQLQVSSVLASPSGYTLGQGQALTLTVPASYLGDTSGAQGRVCRTLSNTASLYDNYAGAAPGSTPQASTSNAATGCGAGLGLEPWWSYVTRNVAVGSDAHINVANGNLVLTATDTTPIQAHGHLTHVTRRVYNSQDTTAETLPGSIGKGWQLNLGMSDDLASTGVTGTALRIPTVTDAASLVTNPLGVTLVDRDGTRHTFTPRVLNVPAGGAGAAGKFTGAALNLAGLPSRLGTLTPLALQIPSGRIGCVDLAYDPPAGVHLSLWRYLAVVSSNSSCDRSTWTQAGTGAPVALGYAAIRPDRLRTEYDDTGHLLAMTDQAGVTLRYTWNLALNQLTSVTEGPCGSNCRTTTFTYNPSGVTQLANVTSMDVRDPAGRTTTYQFATSTLGGAYPAGIRLLTSVLNPDDGQGGVRDRVDYYYQGDGTGHDCSGTAGQLCAVTDERGNTSTFSYDAGTATAPLIGPARIVSFRDRRRDSHTSTGYATFLAYSDRSSSAGSTTTVTMTASGNPSGNSATPANTDRDTAYSNIDSTGRVGQVIQGQSPLASNSPLRTTVYTWDTTSSLCPGMSKVDNDLCSLKRIGSAKPTGSDGTDTPDESTTWRYDDAGMVLQTRRSNGGGDLVSTNGVTRQYTAIDGTTTTAPESDTVDTGSNAPSTTPLLTLYSLADRTSSVSPRGYRTNYVIDADPNARPNTSPSSGTCTVTGSGTTMTATQTGNTGLLCAASQPTAAGTANVTSRYDTLGQLLVKTDPNGNPTSYAYYADTDTDLSGTTGAGGWLRTVTDATGAFVAYGYDAAGNLVRSWDRNATTDSGLPASSFPGTLASPPSGSSGSVTGVVPHADTTYGPGSLSNAAQHPWRWVSSRSDNLGHTTTYTRDAAGNILASTDPLSHTTSMTYDEDNQLLSVLTAANAQLSPQAYQLFSYDAFGEQVSSTDPAAAQTNSATPSEAGRTSNVTRRTYYDPVGRPTDVWTVRQTTTATSPPPGCQNNSGTGGLGDPMLPPNGMVCGSHTAYDSVDNPVWTRDSSGAATSRSYDATHRLLLTISPAVNTPISGVTGIDTSRPQTGYAYDFGGNVTTVCRPRQYSEYGTAASPCTASSTGDVTQYGYDPADRRVSIRTYRTTSTAYTENLTYDVAGNLLSDSDRNTHVTSYTYDVLNRRITTSTPRYSTTSYLTSTLYDPSGSVIGTVAPGANSTNYRISGTRYDADHRPIDTVTGLQATLVPSGQAVQAADASNRSALRAALNSALDSQTATGTTNTRTRRVYDAAGNVVATYLPRAFTSGVPAYDDTSQPNNSSAAGGFSSSSMTRTDYDRDNRPTATWTARADSTVTDPLVSSQPASSPEAAQCTDPGPSLAGLPTYPAGTKVCKTVLSYDADGRVTDTLLPTATAARASRHVTAGYTTDGLLQTTRSPAPSDTATGTNTVATSYTYDGAGRQSSTTEPGDSSPLTTATSYAPAGTVVRIDEPSGSTGRVHWTETRYNLDAQPNLTRTPRTASGTPTGTPTEIDTTTSSYTADGLLSRLDQPGQSLSDFRHTGYGYDGVGNTTYVTSPSGYVKEANNTAGKATLLGYTQDNLLAKSTVPVTPDGNTTRVTDYALDPAGRVVGTTLSKSTTTAVSGTTGPIVTDGSYTKSTYADNDRLLSQTVNAADSHAAGLRTFGYDADGNQTCALSTTGSTASGAAPAGTGSCATPSGSAAVVTASFFLDGLTRTVSQHWPGTTGTRTTRYSYDGTGAPTAWQQDTATGSLTTTISRNDAGLPVSQTSPLLGTSATTWQYNNHSQPKRQTNANGSTQTWNYDAGDNLLSDTGLASSGSSSNDLAQWTYNYDEQGRILTQTHRGRKADGTTEPLTTYTYRYDPAGRVTTFINGTTTINSSYDHDNNRLTNGTVNYSYNADDSVATIADSSNTLDAAGGKTQTYDVEGDLTDDGCNTLTYTGFDQTLTITPKVPTALNGVTTTVDPRCGTATLNYAYDALGRQITSNSDTPGTLPTDAHKISNTTLYYNGLTISTLSEATTGNQAGNLDYTPSALTGDLAATATSTSGGNPTTQYLTDDGTGSVGATTGASSCLLHYTPAGQPTNDNTATPHTPTASPCSDTGGSTTSTKQYRDERRDNQTGTYQLGNRTYDPNRASFTTTDTTTTPGAGGPGGIQTDPLTNNTYSYVNGDPVNFIDPSGHEPRLVPGTTDSYYGYGCNPACTPATARARELDDHETQRFHNQAIAAAQQKSSVIVAGTMGLLDKERHDDPNAYAAQVSRACHDLPGAFVTWVPPQSLCETYFRQRAATQALVTAYAPGFDWKSLIPGMSCLSAAHGQSVASNGAFCAVDVVLTLSLVGKAAEEVGLGLRSLSLYDLRTAADGGAIGFAEGEGQSALTAGRLQHGTRHLSDAGVLPPWAGSTSPQIINDALTPILENPLATFDETLSGTAVKGFLGDIGDQPVAVFVFKEGPYQGQLATSYVPSPAQLSKWNFG